MYTPVMKTSLASCLKSNLKKSQAFCKAWLLYSSKTKVYFFFLALGFGKSVIEPSKISAAKPIDSFSVG